MRSPEAKTTGGKQCIKEGLITSIARCEYSSVSFENFHININF